jgi:hypothetical protein
VNLREQARALVLLQKWLEATGDNWSLKQIEELRLDTREFVEHSPASDGAEAGS